MSEPGYPGESLLSSDKRNRHPNWTDAEIIRFLDLLQEEPTMRDLVAQRNKQVLGYASTLSAAYSHITRLIQR